MLERRSASTAAGEAGALAIGLAGGPTRHVRRAAGPGATPASSVEHVELDAPSLDDVFADATGRRLEELRRRRGDEGPA